MRLEELIGHQRPREWFSSAIGRDRLGSTFLFVGPEAIGKRTFALLLAQGLLCEHATEGFNPCDTCESCIQIKAQTHPDLLMLAKPANKSYIPVESLIGP